ncbi:44456_t:CDS:1, partial [Gigaspora margarita]
IYNSKRISTLFEPIVFGLQLKYVKQSRDSCHRSNIICPLEILSNLRKRYRIKQIGKK